MREGSLLYLEELNRIPEETLNVLITAMAERELVVPRLGRIDAADGFVLVAAMNPFDASAPPASARRSPTGCAASRSPISTRRASARSCAARPEAASARSRSRSPSRAGRAAHAGGPDAAPRSGARSTWCAWRAGSPACVGRRRSDRDALLDAAVAALSGRVRVHEDQDRTVEEVIAELLDRALAPDPEPAPGRAGAPPAGPRPDGAAP